MSKFSMGFHPNKLKPNPTTGKTPIFVRFLFNGKKMEKRLPSDYDLDNHELEKWNYSSQRIDAKESDINNYLSIIATRKRLLDLDSFFKNNEYNPEKIINKLLDTEEKPDIPYVYTYAKLFLEKDIEQSSKAIGTIVNYRNAINQFCTFLEFYKWEKLMLHEFSSKHAKGFKQYLESSLAELTAASPSNPVLKKLQLTRKLTKEKNQVVSSSTKIKNVKPIFEKAIEERHIVSNPFKKIKLDFTSEETPALNIYQLKRIYDLDFAHDLNLQFSKDLFLFMSFTGLSIGDAQALSTNKFEVYPSGIHLQNQRRIKTKQRIKQILSSYASELIYKYWNGKWTIEDVVIFPKETPENINRKLKIIGSLAQLTFPLVTKVGRVTFKNLLREAKVNDFQLIRQNMGWSNNKFIESVYDRYTESDFLDARDKIDIYLNKHLKERN